MALNRDFSTKLIRYAGSEIGLLSFFLNLCTAGHLLP